MRILICGDRNWTDFITIYTTLQQYQHVAEVVIEGGANGADSLGRDAAEALRIPVEEFPAQWETYGRAAGPIRNRQMLVDGRPDLVLAFHPNIDQSLGTKDMVDQAQKAGIKTIVFDANGAQQQNITLF